MARPVATAEQKAAVQNKIRHAAMALYREQGLNHLTARSIAQRAGVAVGTIYAHFGSLQALARTLWQAPVERFEQTLHDTVAGVDAPLERVQRLCAAYLHFARTNEELYRGAFLFIRPPGEKSPAPSPFQESVFAQLLISAIRDGQSRNQVIRTDATQLAQLVWSTLHGIIALPVNLDRFNWSDTTEIDEQAITHLLHALRS